MFSYVACLVMDLADLANSPYEIDTLIVQIVEK